MTEKDYELAVGIRRSDLWRVHDSPEKYKWFLEHPEPQTPSMAFGIAAHKLLLEPLTYYDEVAVMPKFDRRTKDGKSAYEAFMFRNNTKTIVSQEDYDVVFDMVTKAKSVPYVKELLKGEHEKSFFWTDADTGLPCKIRVDMLADVDGVLTVADYKTANNARTEAFNNDIYRLGYYLQAFMYTEGIMQNLKLTERPDFVFVVQEKTPPYAVNVIKVTEDVMLAGMDCFRELLGTVAKCKEMGYWWGYNGMYGEPNETFLPGWMQTGYEKED